MNNRTRSRSAHATSSQTLLSDTSSQTSSIESTASEQDTMATPHQPHQERNLGYARFGSANNKVRAEAWIGLFEIHLQDRSPSEKVKSLYRYLDSDPLNWYAEEVAALPETPEWAQVKQMFIDRFGTPVVRAIIQAQERYLKKSESVQQYYTDKVYLMRQSGLKPLDSIAMLTKGMPLSYKMPLISRCPQTLQEWLTCALEIEAAQASTRSFTPRILPQLVTAHAAKVSNNSSRPRNQTKTSRKPPGPCRFCEAAGQQEWHWHNECPRRVADTKTTPDEGAVISCATSSKN